MHEVGGASAIPLTMAPFPLLSVLYMSPLSDTSLNLHAATLHLHLRPVLQPTGCHSIFHKSISGLLQNLWISLNLSILPFMNKGIFTLLYHGIPYPLIPQTMTQTGRQHRPLPLHHLMLPCLERPTTLITISALHTRHCPHIQKVCIV